MRGAYTDVKIKTTNLDKAWIWHSLFIDNKPFNQVLINV